jgi:hypothetical protein
VVAMRNTKTHTNERSSVTTENIQPNNFGIGSWAKSYANTYTNF